MSASGCSHVEVPARAKPESVHTRASGSRGANPGPTSQPAQSIQEENRGWPRARRGRPLRRPAAHTLIHASTWRNISSCNDSSNCDKTIRALGLLRRRCLGSLRRPCLASIFGEPEFASLATVGFGFWRAWVRFASDAWVRFAGRGWLRFLASLGSLRQRCLGSVRWPQLAERFSCDGFTLWRVMVRFFGDVWVRFLGLIDSDSGVRGFGSRRRVGFGPRPMISDRAGAVGLFRAR